MDWAATVTPAAILTVASEATTMDTTVDTPGDIPVATTRATTNTRALVTRTWEAALDTLEAPPTRTEVWDTRVVPVPVDTIKCNGRGTEESSAVEERHGILNASLFC